MAYRTKKKIIPRNIYIAAINIEQQTNKKKTMKNVRKKCTVHTFFFNYFKKDPTQFLKNIEPFMSYT
jgi:hypothetical protein